MWKIINDFPNYEVSKGGLIRNKQTKVVLSPFVNNNGYLRVSLQQNGIGVKKMVHVLVAKAYVNNPLNLNEVDHINNNRKDNRACNLKYCSHSENIKKVWHAGGFRKRLKNKREE